MVKEKVREVLVEMAYEGELVFPRSPKAKVKSIDQLVDLTLSGVAGYKFFNYTPANWTGMMKILFPSKPNRVHMHTYVLSKINYRRCATCSGTLPSKMFYKDARQCKGCGGDSSREWKKTNREAVNGWEVGNRLARESLRRAIKSNAKPSWYKKDKRKISVVYEKSKEWSKRLGVKLHVDHIVPLNSKTVCGLHCFANLQLLEATLNIAKSNKYEQD